MGGSALPMYKSARTGQAKLADASAFTEKSKLVLKKAPFSDLCKHIIKTSIESKGLRMATQVRETLMEASEAHLKHVAVKANRIRLHEKLSTLKASHLDLAWTIDVPVTVEDEHRKIKKGPKVSHTILKSIFKKAGADRVGEDCYQKSQEILEKFLLEILECCNHLAQSRRTKSTKDVVQPTITAADVAYALRTTDSKLYGVAAVSR